MTQQMGTGDGVEFGNEFPKSATRRRRKGSEPLLCFHRGKGLFYVTLNGREFYLGSDKGAARGKRRRLLNGWRNSGHCLPASRHDLTITELLRAYRDYAEEYYRGPDGQPTGQMPLVKLAVRRLRTMYGDTSVGDFGPLKLQALRRKLIDERLSRSYINATINRIRAIFKWAESQELVPAAMYQTLATVQGLKAGRSAARETAPVEAIDNATLEATLKHLSPTVADMARIERLTGCRPGEVCMMRPCDIDRSRAVWVYAPPRHKNAWRGKQRRIFIGADVQPLLAPYLLRADDAYCFSPREALAKMRAAKYAERKTPLSCGNRPGYSSRTRLRSRSKKGRKHSPPGERYTTQSYTSAIRRAALKAGVQHWSANRLRHAAAKEIQSRFGLEHAAAVLGNTVTVAARYAKHNYDLAEQVMADRSAAREPQDSG